MNWRAAAVGLACLLLGSVPAMAADVWEQKNGEWYFYVKTDAAQETEVAGNTEAASGETAVSGENAAALYNGWMQAGENSWYYFVDSRMMTGWITDGGRWYALGDDGLMLRNQWVGNFYVVEDGAALMDTTAPDGTKLSAYGSRMRNGKAVEGLNDKTARYAKILEAHPDAKVEFTSPGQIVKDSLNGYSFITFKTMKLYDRQSGELLYSGDGCFRQNAVLETAITENGISSMQPMGLMEQNYLYGDRVYMDPAGLITSVAQSRRG